METEHIDVIGSGFVPGIPGTFGNNRITAKGEVVPVLIASDTTSDAPSIEQPTPPSESVAQLDPEQPSYIPPASESFGG